jgi:hypothetical protein
MRESEPIMRRAEDYVRMANRQRRIAASLPSSAFRQRFLASAERLEALARASGELGPGEADDS